VAYAEDAHGDEEATTSSRVTTTQVVPPEKKIELDWAQVKRTILQYFPLDGKPPASDAPDIMSLQGRALYKDFYMWYQQQPHLFVSAEVYSEPIAVLALQAFVMFTSNDSERCIQLREHSALVD
ncbi:unnamed protein product, partial [Amoebophrya sp. A25]